jgi:hypothetical protein
MVKERRSRLIAFNTACLARSNNREIHATFRLGEGCGYDENDINLAGFSGFGALMDGQEIASLGRGLWEWRGGEEWYR